MVPEVCNEWSGPPPWVLRRTIRPQEFSVKTGRRTYWEWLPEPWRHKKKAFHSFGATCCCSSFFCLDCRLLYFNFKADLKARMECHRLEKKYYGTKRCCEKCDAVQLKNNAVHPMNYKDMSANAPYLATRVNHEEYLHTFRPLSPWLSVPGFQLETLVYDWMHLVYLGTARSHVASAIKLLRMMGHYYEHGESDETYLRRLTADMRKTCKAQKCLDSDSRSV